MPLFLVEGTFLGVVFADGRGAVFGEGEWSDPSRATAIAILGDERSPEIAPEDEAFWLAQAGATRPRDPSGRSRAAGTLRFRPCPVAPLRLG